MLDNETKRRIDTARDILVGKVPDPKSQVEQITIALVYKFMDDMDKESVEMGGKASFFTGDYERYAWSKIFDPRIGGHEMLGLYGEAIVKLNQNPNIPQLFRDIFKNAYLPYRDPETLKLFLKTINEFTYDHSEKLGDAYEYLLSVLGSQGDAGQFRTPRHIIDFMVQIVNPQKHEQILDPACGTAGFLISSYKHILKENTKKIPGDLLTGEERKKLLTNFKGYDISPDMVRLSLVNLYLHGFVQPQILEYDTLTSEERWNEYADVIMANPPFMSPKGGIKPHKKFSVQSNRSEVLFVDYIADHLTPTGRAAVIVPEGIIFQSANAYKQLRKMLVENHLYAVVSLPAGVFNPYSGVKTSILLMDRQISKNTDSILFIKIENEGTDLGAQRKITNKNDLPDFINIINDWRASIYNRSALNDFSAAKVIIVKKSELSADGEYNLTAERYKSQHVFDNAKYEMVSLSILLKECNDRVKNLKIQVWSVSNQHGFVNTEEYFKKNVASADISNYKIVEPITFAYNPSRINVGSIAINQKDVFGAVSPMYVVFKIIDDRLNNLFLYKILKSHQLNTEINRLAQGAVRTQLRFRDLININIPLPPLEVQREIVAEIEGYQKLIDGFHQVVESWKPQIDIDPEWPMVKLGEVIDTLETGVSVNSTNRKKVDGEFGILKTSSVTYGVFNHEEHKAVIPEEVERLKCNPRKNAILISRMNTEDLVGASAYVDKDYPNLFLPDRLWQTVITRNDVNVRFIHQIISSESYRKRISDICGGTSGSMKNISKVNFMEIIIPLPLIEDQDNIVESIETERKVIDGCRELIKIYEDKIKRVIDKVWEE